MIRLYSVIIPVRFFYTPPIGARAVETCRNNRVICSDGCILDGNGPTRSHDFLLDKIDRSLNSAFSITPRNVYTATFKLMQFNEIHSATLSEFIVVNDKLNKILLSFFPHKLQAGYGDTLHAFLCLYLAPVRYSSVGIFDGR